MNNSKSGLLKKVGLVLGIIAFIVAAFAIDGLLRLLSDVPIIGILARWILHLRETAH